MEYLCEISRGNFAKVFLQEFLQSFFVKSRIEKDGLRELMHNLAAFSQRKFAFENFCSQRERKNIAFFLG